LKTILQSPAKPVFKKFLSLTTAKGLKAEGLFILSGEKLVREFLRNPHLRIEAEVLLPEGQAMSSARSVFELSRPLFEQLDSQGTHFNILILQQPPLEEWLSEAAPQGLEVVCPLGDPANLGALIRSAEAFGARQVILTREAAHPFLPKAVKASAGSVLRIPLVRGPSVQELSSSLIALDSNGPSLHNFQWPTHTRLLVGEEGSGLDGMKFEQTLSIPTVGVESLNAVVAASIAFHDYARKNLK
jgi:TrmH family RNA methyltransferase